MSGPTPEMPSLEEQARWLEDHCRCPWAIPRDATPDTIIRKAYGGDCENHKPEEARYGDFI